jgi:L-iditol 2-dehydrogenase
LCSDEKEWREGFIVKALVLKEYNHLVYQDVPEPQIGPEDVLIQVKACGICVSDVHGVDGSTGRRIPPIVMGHEAAGVITEVGSAVSTWKEGDRVTFDSMVSCGKCYFCRRGLANLCDNRCTLGVSTEEYRRDGALAEYVAVPQQILYQLPEEISFVQAATVEPLSVALHAVGRVPIAVNDTAVVIGTGPIGLFIVQCLRVAGCGQIVAVDLDQNRLDLARNLGADLGLRSDRDDVLAEVLKLTDNRGADIALEAVGITPTINLAVRCLRKGGSVALVGTFSPVSELLVQDVVYRQLSLLGSAASSGEYPGCLKLMARGAINVDALISAVAPLAEGASWFERLYKGEPHLIKVILEP